MVDTITNSLRDEFWIAVTNSDAARVKELLGHPQVAVLVDSICPESVSMGNMFPIHLACTLGDERVCQVLLEHGACPSRLSVGGYNALHHAAASGYGECASVLLDGSNTETQVQLLSALTTDHSFYLAGTAIYMPGGQTAAHVAATNGNTDFFDAVESALAEGSWKDTWDALLATPDFDHCTVTECALLHRHERLAARLGGGCPGEGAVALEDRQRAIHRERQARFAQGRARRREEERERRAIRERFRPKGPVFQECEEGLLRALCPTLWEPILEARRLFEDRASPAVTGRVRDLALSFSPAAPGNGILLVPQIFAVDRLEEIVLALEDYERSGLPITRPNDKVPLGMVLEDNPGFEGLLGFLEHRVFVPLAWVLYTSLAPGIAQSLAFNPTHRKTFVKQYFPGRDTKPTTHFDPSVLTFSLCLGRSFEGSAVYFHDMHNNREDSCPYRPAHPKPCTDCRYVHHHQPGQLLIHRGKHVHGV
eukprot:CAMPEP_0119158428 /NCGR_PEP_ID=MMETSP1310-20130426/53256_1 /TAXON_ID=464262 /ORGANISM="Genus nov. species nov., Strain RCC2339" /LENGTH=480 /DNA_ID=CAMNT_0007151053 /DNA_START=144 /DNA_END=1582 /DNA_ORIENTATION=+